MKLLWLPRLPSRGLSGEDPLHYLRGEQYDWEILHSNDQETLHVKAHFCPQRRNGQKQAYQRIVYSGGNLEKGVSKTNAFQTFKRVCLERKGVLIEIKCSSLTFLPVS